MEAVFKQSGKSCGKVIGKSEEGRGFCMEEKRIAFHTQVDEFLWKMCAGPA